MRLTEMLSDVILWTSAPVLNNRGNGSRPGMMFTMTHRGTYTDTHTDTDTDTDTHTDTDTETDREQTPAHPPSDRHNKRLTTYLYKDQEQHKLRFLYRHTFHNI